MVFQKSRGKFFFKLDRQEDKIENGKCGTDYCTYRTLLLYAVSIERIEDPKASVWFRGAAVSSLTACIACID
jgi:hypothetical protein